MISTTVETEDTMQPVTWADGFGLWHVRVSRHAASPLIAARRSLRDELQARERNLDPRIFMHPIRVTDLDTEDAVVYREGELVRCPTTRITTDGTEHTIVGCGSTNVVEDTSEPGLYDCRDCGIWFHPATET
jgi:hypothetical protein